MHPAIVVAAPQPANGEGERHSHEREADKQHRRVDEHPHVLERRVESFAVRRRHRHAILHQRHERVADQHIEQERRLDRHKNREHIRLGVARAAHQELRRNHAPQRPDHE